MSFNDDSAHPMKKRLSRPPTIAASSCLRCHRQGIVSLDQANVANAKGGTQDKHQTRFDCVCGNTWATSTTGALAHGRFLDRAGLR